MIRLLDCPARFAQNVMARGEKERDRDKHARFFLLVVFHMIERGGDISNSSSMYDFFVRSTSPGEGVEGGSSFIYFFFPEKYFFFLYANYS